MKVNNPEVDEYASTQTKLLRNPSTDEKIEVESVPEVKAQENLNVRAAVIHMIGDLITSLGVIIAATLIYINEDWKIADPICTFIFSILVLFTTFPVMSDCIRVLLEGSPEEIDSVKVYNALKKVSKLISI